MAFPFLHRLKTRVAKQRILQRPDIDIAPSARVNYLGMHRSPPSRLRIGDGTIFEGTIASDRLGSTVTIGSNTFVGHSSLVCAERIEIGDDVLISWGCTIVDHDSHALDWAGRKDDVRNWYRGEKVWDRVVVRPVSIGNKVWIGFNVIVLKGVTIGEGAVVGAGSIVTRDVPPYTVVAGNPARVIRSIAYGRN